MDNIVHTLNKRKKEKELEQLGFGTEWKLPTCPAWDIGTFTKFKIAIFMVIVR